MFGNYYDYTLPFFNKNISVILLLKGHLARNMKGLYKLV